MTTPTDPNVYVLPASYIDRCSEVLEEVLAERGRQHYTYGDNDDLRFSSGRSWLSHTSANLDLMDNQQIEAALRREYEDTENHEGAPSWMHLLREEFAEAMAELDSGSTERLRTELLQVAAVAVSWVETIDRTGA